MLTTTTASRCMHAHGTGHGSEDEEHCVWGVGVQTQLPRTFKPTNRPAPGARATMGSRCSPGPSSSSDSTKKFMKGYTGGSLWPSAGVPSRWRLRPPAGVATVCELDPLSPGLATLGTATVPRGRPWASPTCTRETEGPSGDLTMVDGRPGGAVMAVQTLSGVVVVFLGWLR